MAKSHSTIGVPTERFNDVTLKLSAGSDLSTTLSQSRFATFPASAGLDLSTEIIVISMFNIIADYQGTRAALEAEGVIPTGTEWPEGFNETHWKDDKFSYWLRRERPAGPKGPRKQFLNLDWWMLRINPAQPQYSQMVIERKAKELAEAIYRQSAKGSAEIEERWERYWAAKKDEKFQAFKALIPGINRPKRGSRLKNTEQSQGASA